jgi:putative nucleotidyltransferase with HDIG domain
VPASIEDFNQFLEKIASLIPEKHNVYLVGGAVRDLLFNRKILDWDFVTDHDARPIARTLANQMGGAYYVLDEERKTARVILEQGTGKIVMDFATLRADSIEGDLWERDFTVNAIAIDIRSRQHLIDPTGGQKDLTNKIIRCCRPESFSNDPARVLRALRLAIHHGLRIEKETLRYLKQAVPLLPQVSVERQRDELFKMFESGTSRTAVELMDNTGILNVILPELRGLKGCKQSPPHVWDVWFHTLAVLNQLDILLDVLTQKEENRHFSAESLLPALSISHLGKYRSKLAEHFITPITANRSRRALLSFAALLHDIGKSVTQSVENDGRIRFFEHETQGANMAAQIGEKWMLSRDEAQYLEKMTALHMRIHWLANNETLPDKRVIHRFFRDAGSEGIDICILSLADLLATQGTQLPVEVWNKELQICALMLDAWYEQKDKIVTPEKLLSGKDIMEILGLAPGAMVGNAISALKEAQAVGEVLTFEAAVNYIKQWYQRQL